MNIEFLKPRLDGGRFSEHALPLELLKDFSALEEMIVEIAKWKFRENHPERERISRGFGKGLELQLAGIEKGSAIPEIRLAFAPMLVPPFETIYFEQARDAIIETIACAEQCKPLPLPSELLGYFDRFGRGLRGHEFIEFLDKNSQPARLTLETRKRLIRASKAEEWTEEMPLKGRIFEVDQVRMSFELELKDGTKLKAPLTNQHLDIVLEASTGFRKGMQVTVQCVVKKDRQDHLRSIESVEHISPLDPLDVESRLEELAELQNGWLDGKGIAPNGDGLLWLTKEFDVNFSPVLPLPYLYPTAEGGVQAEWSIGNWEASLEVNLDKKHGEWHAFNVKTNQCFEQSWDLSDSNAWQAFNQKLEALISEEVA